MFKIMLNKFMSFGIDISTNKYIKNNCNIKNIIQTFVFNYIIKKQFKKHILT